MAIKLHISPKIINSVASLYNDTNRIFMEYIDNALDSAEGFFSQNSNGYNKKICITLKITGNNYKNGVVTITDNCTGIKNFNKVVESIGYSDKRGEFTTNGQFGFGIYSFMAACAKLEIKSKVLKSDALYLPILRSQFDTSKQDDVSFPDPKIIQFDQSSGTVITLSNFDKEMWKNIDLEVIKTDVQKHFEQLLTRSNLEVQIVNSLDEEYSCKPFDYNSIEGEVLEEQVFTLKTTKGRKIPQEFEIKLDKPIKLFLKITKGKTLEKKPVFIIKGRRIAEIKDVASFRSSHKSDIWAHPNLTGYIDLGGFLEPTIARNDFKNTPQSKAVFEKLYELEELVLEFLKDVNKKSEEKHYKELEDELNRALSKLAKLDSMNFRTELISGKAKSALKTEIDENSTTERNGDGTETDKYLPGDGKYKWEGNGNSQREESSDKEQKKPNEPDNPFDDGDFTGEEKKKSGFNIEISDNELVTDDETKEEIRSLLFGGTILIYRKHPEFIKRVDKKRTGESKITQRLITYLAGEITIHYKDKFITRSGQPEYNKKMFGSVVEFIYKFEDLLGGLINKNLGDIINESAN
ncbi:MAG: hypothetical protein K0Q79_2841 [Flavipsychrobacter sp.]|jgi:hypothetical protein|nr:hypothetical protein [Flavipsychrobacter sp.]